MLWLIKLLLNIFYKYCKVIIYIYTKKTQYCFLQLLLLGLYSWINDTQMCRWSISWHLKGNNQNNQIDKLKNLRVQHSSTVTQNRQAKAVPCWPHLHPASTCSESERSSTHPAVRSLMCGSEFWWRLEILIFRNILGAHLESWLSWLYSRFKIDFYIDSDQRRSQKLHSRMNCGRSHLHSMTFHILGSGFVRLEERQKNIKNQQFLSSPSPTSLNKLVFFFQHPSSTWSPGCFIHVFSLGASYTEPRGASSWALGKFCRKKSSWFFLLRRSWLFDKNQCFLTDNT